MCHNKHSHFALTDIVHSGYCGLAISICVWQHTVAKTEVLKQASWLPCRNTRQSNCSNDEFDNWEFFRFNRVKAELPTSTRYLMSRKKKREKKKKSCINKQD